jgi:HSP20 family protein
MHGVEPSAMLRRDPFADVQELLSRIGWLVPPSGETETDRPWVPIAEIDESDDAYMIKLELPGVAPADIEIGITDRELCINGEVREEEEGSSALRVRVGRFHYHTSLPSDVDEKNVEASMDEGVLTVRVPKAAQGRTRRVEVTEARPKGQRRSRQGMGASNTSEERRP